MLFSSPIFLFMFLPLLLIVYFLVNKSAKNVVLLIFSLIFYAWGEPVYVLVMFASIIANYLFALGVNGAENNVKLQRAVLVLAVVFNIGMLFYFKYTNFFIENINALLALFSIENIPYLHVVMPIGISFFTFQSMSYVIDVYRDKVAVEKSFINVALYISLFPQLIAGPIVRYVDVAKEIHKREVTLPKFVAGARRFIVGLGKKVIVANTVALIADNVFAMDMANLSTSLAWLGVLCYTIQIYFDFSGYSDMAIGLGQMFGFVFLENFDYPYISKSITEFWRRWHISLSTWFKDYLYIPLGGNRKGLARTYVNLLIVFFITGFWHGASWNFIVWGLYHGLFQIIEKSGIIDKILAKIKLSKDNLGLGAVSHVVTLLIVVIGWVFFRAETLPLAGEYLSRMFGLSSPETVLLTVSHFLNARTVLILLLAVPFSTPLLKTLFSEKTNSLLVDRSKAILQDVALLAVFLLTIMALASSVYNPFIYFRF